jgi:hypothetical protein
MHWDVLGGRDREDSGERNVDLRGGLAQGGGSVPSAEAPVSIAEIMMASIRAAESVMGKASFVPTGEGRTSLALSTPT